MRLRLWVAIFAIAFICVGASAQSKIKVACVGNSITAGSGIEDRARHSYPAVLQQLLGERYEVINYGLSGRTLLYNGDRPYKNEENFVKVQEYQPDIVIIKLGTNDSKIENWDSHSVEFEGDLRNFVNTFKNLDSKPDIYLCFPIWAANDRYTIRESVIAGEIIPVINKVAQELGVKIIDLHTTLYGMPQLIPDGIHPNELGAALIAYEVFNRIK
ncbi:MAG: GDSL-type esterase/lipase family protein [Rikenellaceae bacterium]|nr:GDSL-type esterase/lipase family protein [Rikenellaceae bacterium]